MTATTFNDTCSEKDLDLETEPEPRPKSKCPDGGWGWVIVFASFVCNVIVDGICFSFGIFAQEIIKSFDADHSKSALVGSLLVGCYLMAGPVVSALANRFGCRKVTILGSVLTCVAFLISTNSPSIEVLILTYGIIGGIGLGLIYLPAIVIIGYWFERKRAFATGIALCGSGIGSLIFAPLNKKLIEEYDWRQSTVIIAGIVLHCAICGALFRPLEKAKNKRMKRGVVQRGSIMKALIAEKERQRTISNGSLDNCIITKDNRLIKIDKIDLRNKSNSYLHRLREQLGFSSRSLNKSKNSLIISSFLPAKLQIDSQPQTPVQEKKEVKRERKRDFERRRDSGCGNSLSGSPKAQNNNYNSLPQEDPWEQGTAPNLETNSVSLNSVTGSLSAMAKENGNAGSYYSLQEPNALRNSNTNNNQLLPPPAQCIMGNSIMSGQYSASVRTFVYSEEDEEQPPCCCQPILDMFDLSLFKDKAFDLYAVCSFLNMLGFYIPFFFLPEMVESILQDDNSDGVPLILAVIGLSTTVGRVVAGWIADRPWADAIHINNTSLVLAGAVTILCPFCTGMGFLALFSVGFGLFTAAFLSLRSIVLVELIGLERLTSSFGLLILFQGFASVAGPPLAGWLMDTTGSPDSVFYMAGALLALAGILGYPLRRFKRCRNPDEAEDPYGYHYSSEQEMIETVKMAQYETTM